MTDKLQEEMEYQCHGCLLKHKETCATYRMIDRLKAENEHLQATQVDADMTEMALDKAKEWIAELEAERDDYKRRDADACAKVVDLEAELKSHEGTTVPFKLDAPDTQDKPSDKCQLCNETGFVWANDKSGVGGQVFCPDCHGTGKHPKPSDKCDKVICPGPEVFSGTGKCIYYGSVGQCKHPKPSKEA